MCVQVTAIEPGLLRKKRRILIIDLFDVKKNPRANIYQKDKLFVQLVYRHVSISCQAVCCSMLQCVAVCCSVLQFVAVYCSLLQCVAVCCTYQHHVNIYQIVRTACSWTRINIMSSSVLQCVAVCCSVLQCFAVCCSVLQCVARINIMSTEPYTRSAKEPVQRDLHVWKNTCQKSPTLCEK